MNRRKGIEEAAKSFAELVAIMDKQYGMNQRETVVFESEKQKNQKKH